jgi:hypothetical protein
MKIMMINYYCFPCIQALQNTLKSLILHCIVFISKIMQVESYLFIIRHSTKQEHWTIHAEDC